LHDAGAEKRSRRSEADLRNLSAYQLHLRQASGDARHERRQIMQEMDLGYKTRLADLPVLSRKAVATLLNLSKKREQELSAVLAGLANTPPQLGESQFSNNVGRRIQCVLISGYVVDYWLDHASKNPGCRNRLNVAA
jgi:hypothetical protein